MSRSPYLLSNILSSTIGRMIVALSCIFVPLFMRENFYKESINYKIQRARGYRPTLDSQLVDIIRLHPEVFDRQVKTIREIIHISLKITAEYLDYNSDPSLKTDPLSIYISGEANSVGFANFFTAVCEYLIATHHASERVKCRSFIAERLKKDKNLNDAYRYIHNQSQSPFLRERDIVAIMDVKTGVNRFVDPTLFEQASIIYINVANKTLPPPPVDTISKTDSTALFRK